MTAHTVHPRRRVLHEPPETLGERAADAIAGGVGSWAFVLSQASFTALWLLANTLHGWGHWDQYPYVLLNLVYSFQAGFTGPILLLAAKRAAVKDRLRDDLEAREVDESQAILKRLDITQATQLEILQELRELNRARRARAKKEA